MAHLARSIAELDAALELPGGIPLGVVSSLLWERPRAGDLGQLLVEAEIEICAPMRDDDEARSSIDRTIALLLLAREQLPPEVDG